MKASIKKQWVEALRSGEYKQGEGQLQGTDDDGNPLYCCLGVLACIVDPTKQTWDGEDGLFGVNSGACVYPDEFTKKQDELIGGGLDPEIASSLTSFNDGGCYAGTSVRPPKSFEWIASYIERYL